MHRSVYRLSPLFYGARSRTDEKDARRFPPANGRDGRRESTASLHDDVTCTLWSLVVRDGPPRLGDGECWYRNAEGVLYLCEDVCSCSLFVIDDGGTNIPDLRKTMNRPHVESWRPHENARLIVRSHGVRTVCCCACRALQLSPSATERCGIGVCGFRG